MFSRKRKIRYAQRRSSGEEWGWRLYYANKLNSARSIIRGNYSVIWSYDVVHWFFRLDNCARHITLNHCWHGRVRHDTYKCSIRTLSINNNAPDSDARNRRRDVINRGILSTRYWSVDDDKLPFLLADIYENGRFGEATHWHRSEIY